YRRHRGGDRPHDRAGGGGSRRPGVRRRVDLPQRTRQARRLRRLFVAPVRQMSEVRRTRVRALAKINLDLRVLGRRPDGYHELRTIFQTISLADTLEIEFTPGRKTSIALEDTLHIADNLVIRAARMAMDAMRATGSIRMRLTKRIPIGAGLGGGSSDAAAALLALPPLVGRVLDLPKLSGIGEQLGSDVPFFLLGGTAVGI